MIRIDDSHDDPNGELHELLTDAVADVEPAYRLDTIRARTARKPFRRGWYLTGASVLAAASVVTAVAVLNGPDHGPVPGPSASEAPRTTGLYFVGDTPLGPRLYREWRLVSGGPVAALEAMADGPDDPDYLTRWPEGVFESVTVTDDAIEVELGPWNARDPRLDDLDLQEVVYTVQAATGEVLPVDFVGSAVPDYLPAQVQRLPQNDVLAQASISDPAEGTRVSGSFVARGRANSFEANVPWQVRNSTGEVVSEGFATAKGWGDRLYEWETEVDVSDLTPGTYTFVAMTEDASGGAEGPGPTYDTRTIIVE